LFAFSRVSKKQRPRNEACRPQSRHQDQASGHVISAGMLGHVRRKSMVIFTTVGSPHVFVDVIQATFLAQGLPLKACALCHLGDTSGILALVAELTLTA
jgi:hypothetical protein